MATLLLLQASDSHQSCEGFPYPERWKNLKAVIKHFMLKEDSTDLFKGQLYLVDANGTNVRDVIASSDNGNYQVFENCWKGKGEIRTNLTSEDGSMEFSEWKFYIRFKHGLRISNLTRCTNYTININLVNGTEEGENLILETDFGVVFSGWTVTEPDNEKPLVMTNNPGYFGTRLTISPANERCIGYVDAVIIKCTGDKEWRFPSLDVEIDDLFPNKTYNCEVKIKYTIQGARQQSQKETFEISTVSPTIDVTNKTSHTIDVSLDQRLIDKANVTRTIEVRNQSNLLHILTVEGNPPVIGNLEPDRDYRITLRIYDSRCYAPDCRESFLVHKNATTLEAVPDDPPQVAVTRRESHAFQITVNPPNQPNGKIMNYTVQLQQRCVTIDPNCIDMKNCKKYIPRENSDTLLTTDGTKKQHEPVSLLFDNLEPHYQYKVNVTGYNSAGASPSNIREVTTEPAFDSYKNISFKVDSGVKNASITVDRLCPYQGPMLYTTRIKHNSSDKIIKEQEIKYDVAANRTRDYVQLDGLDVAVQYQACMEVELVNQDPNCTTTCKKEEKCKPFNTLEAVPSDPPEVSVTEIETHTFTIKVSAPSQSNGKIVKYIAKLQTRCQTIDPNCSDMKECDKYIHLKEEEKTLEPYATKEHEPFSFCMRDLKPYYRYKVIVIAFNSAGPSPSNIIKVTTKPAFDFNKDIISFKVDSGVKNASITVGRLCPYQGPILYTIRLKQNHTVIMEKKNKYIVTASKTSTLTVEFDGLKTVTQYQACMEARLVSTEPICKTSCLRQEKCKNFATSPSHVPLAATISIPVVALLLSGLAVLAIIVWKRKRKSVATTGTEMKPINKVSLSAQQHCYADNRHYPLTLESLVRRVSVGRFVITDEYRKIEDLDQRFIISNQSMNEARKWSDKNNR